jgi:hypothetical protein
MVFIDLLMIKILHVYIGIIDISILLLNIVDAGKELGYVTFTLSVGHVYERAAQIS